MAADRSNHHGDVFSLDDFQDFLGLFSKCRELSCIVTASADNPLVSGCECVAVSLGDGDRRACLVAKDLFDSETKFDHPFFPAMKEFLQSRGLLLLAPDIKHFLKSVMVFFNLDVDNVNVLDVLQEAKTLGDMSCLSSLLSPFLGNRVLALNEWRACVDRIWVRLKLGAQDEDFALRSGGVDELGRVWSSSHYEDRSSEITALKILLSMLQDGNQDADACKSALSQFLIAGVDGGDFDSSSVLAPSAVIAESGCRMADGLFKLHKSLFARVESEGVVNACRMYNKHARLAFMLETNGAKWDDEKANEIANACLKDEIDALRFILTSDRCKQALEMQDSDIVNILSASDIGMLKKKFNPNSNQADNVKFFSKVVLTPELRIALMFDFYKKEIRNGRISDYPWLESVLMEMERAGSSYGDLSKIVSVIRDKAQNFSQSESDLLNKFASMSLDSLSAYAIRKAFMAMANFISVDRDDVDSWPVEMKLLLHLKLFKKASKARSTYIDGGLGRDSVRVATRKVFEDGNIPRRREKYNRNLALGSDNVYLRDVTFLCNATDTKRWKSGSHTFPWGAEISSVFTSRFQPGMILHLDYRQMEVSVMARLAEDESLLQACTNGGDVHKLVAAAVLGKAESDVTDADRRIAKHASFSILYGRSERSFANEFLSGDRDEAMRIYDSFFDRFPKVKEHIERSHKLLQDNGYVTTLWGDRIYIDYDNSSDKSFNSAMRMAQNYQTQASASNIAGYCVYRIAEYMGVNGNKAKVFNFAHDACEIDTPADEALSVLHSAIALAQDLPSDMWQLPVSIAVSIGLNGYDVVDLDLGGSNKVKMGADNKLRMKAKFTSRKGVIGRLANALKLGCYEVEWQVKNRYEIEEPIDSVFALSKTYSSDLGAPVEMESGEINAVSKDITQVNSSTVRFCA